MVAAQAGQLRGRRPGLGTGAAIRAIREVVPGVEGGDPVPDVDPLVELVRGGAFGPAALLRSPGEGED